MGTKLFSAFCMLFLVWNNTIYARIWSDSSGQYQIEADLVRVSDDGRSVTLRTEKREITLSVEKLSLADQRFLRDQRLLEAKENLSSKKNPNEVTNSIGMKFVLIPAGEFLMGSPPREQQWAKGQIDKENLDIPLTLYFSSLVNREKQHRVRITKPFHLGVYEVTVGDFRKFVEATDYKTNAERSVINGLGGDGWNESKKELEVSSSKYTWRKPGWEQTDSHPVVNIRWDDAIAFCEWLSKAEEGRRYLLPTEAQWEYACRAGTTTAYYGGNSQDGLVKVGNVLDGTAKEKFSDRSLAIDANDGYAFTAPVGRFEPNDFGIYDMHGNAWEYCMDWVDDRMAYYPSSPVDDPAGPIDGHYRIRRGGGWDSYPWYCRSASRSRYTSEFNIPEPSCGFRVVLIQANE